MIIFSLGIKLAGSVFEPICDERITNFLTSTSKSTSMLIAIILGASFMFLIIIGLVILSLNGAYL